MTAPAPKTRRESDRVTVVVAIYNAFEETRACLESLRHHVVKPHRVLLVDDASRDLRMEPLLDAVCHGDERFSAFKNAKNMGYTATVNIGCRSAEPDDVILLNSDTVVTPGWLEKLHAVSRSRPRVATVTPLSNAAGAFSIPVRHKVNQLPSGISIEQMGRILEQCSHRLYPEVPTGHGFCMYVRRRALDVVGYFDEKTFREGCGEENDFCMRTSEAGFVHLIDDATFVYHKQSASLGWRKRWLLFVAARKLRRRYPLYEHRVAQWLERDPLNPLRSNLLQILDERTADQTSPRVSNGRPS